MRQVLSFLVVLVMIFSAGSAFGFGLETKIDTVFYSTVQNFFFSPIQMSDYNFLGAGARARGMGGAFFAVSNDPTAASWNPAGLSLLDKAQMDLSFNSYMDRGESMTSGLNLNLTEKPEYTKNRVYSASVVIPFKLRDKELVGSVLYQTLSDIYQENKYVLVNDSLEAVIGSGVYVKNLKSTLSEKVTGSLDVVTLALGTKVFGSLSLGSGVNIYAGGFDSDVNFIYPKSTRTDISVYTDVNGADTTAAVNLYRHYHPTIKCDYSGFNFTIGGMYEFEKLRLGAVVKTPFTLKEKNDLRYLVDEWERGVVTEGGVLSTTTEGEADRDWKIPMMVGFGASYKLPSLTLAADLELRNYSNAEVTYHQEALDPLSEEVTVNLDWRNVTQFRIGGEYVFHTKLGDIPIRAGFRNDPKLFKDQHDSLEVFMEEYIVIHIEGFDTLWPTYVKSKPGAETGSWVNGNVFSFGTGIAWSQIKFDITLEFATYDDIQRKVFTEIVAFNQDKRRIEYIVYGPKEFSQKISNKYNRIMVSFTGFF